MQYTSAQANKLLRQLQEERSALLLHEQKSETFVAATVEDLEGARPAYSFADTQQALRLLEEKIRKVKHCINCFNVSHEVEGFGMTVDQMLVYIPQLTERREKLRAMSSALAKTRLSTSGRSNLIEYEYANYDVAAAQADFAAASDELTRAQLALDRLNSTLTMEIDL